MKWMARVAGTILLGGTLSLPAVAAEGDTLRPYVSYARYYDSNLFRLADNEQSDQYGILSAGVNVDWQPGRQRVLASASKNLVRYADNTRLDYDGTDYRLRWNWRLGNRWSGQVGASEGVTQSNFSDLIGLRVNNQITRANRFVDAEWQFHPRWGVAAGVAAADSSNSTSQQRPSDYEENSATASLAYRTPKGSALRGQLRRVDGAFPHRLPGSLDRAYTQTEYNLLGDWRVSGKLGVQSRLGYLQRQNDTLSHRDFSGLAGRLAADYSLSGKTALNWAIYREIANSDDASATYQQSTGTSLGLFWQASAKLALRAGASYENRRFAGDPGFSVAGVAQRDENSLNGSLSLSYAPLRMATVDVGMQAGRRDSNFVRNDYAFHTLFVSVRADF